MKIPEEIAADVVFALVVHALVVVAFLFGVWATFAIVEHAKPVPELVICPCIETEHGWDCHCPEGR